MPAKIERIFAGVSMNEVIGAIFSAVLGGTVTGGILLVFLNNYLNNRDRERHDLANRILALNKDIETLEKERIEKLETRFNSESARFESHIKNDLSQRILAVLDSVSGRLEKMENKSDRFLEEIAMLRKTDEAQRARLSELSADLKAHINRNAA